MRVLPWTCEEHDEVRRWFGASMCDDCWRAVRRLGRDAEVWTDAAAPSGARATLYALAAELARRAAQAAARKAAWATAGASPAR